MEQDPSLPEVRVTFMGVTTLLFDDGHDSILIDGFFTRPSLVRTLLWWITPDEAQIQSCMRKAGIGSTLRAVLVAHSHFDHAMDAPVVCRHSGATLVGSDSTRMIGRGQGLADDQMRVVADGDVLHFGAFKITFITGVHSPGDVAPGTIAEPLKFPASFKALKSAECYSYLIGHGEERVFVHPSANYVPGKLKGCSASTLFLGVGVLGKQSMEFREGYWEHVVQAVQPKRIVPIHWDNFWLPIERPLRPMPSFMDKWDVTKRFLEERCSREGIELCFQQTWEVIDATK